LAVAFKLIESAEDVLAGSSGKDLDHKATIALLLRLLYVDAQAGSVGAAEVEEGLYVAGGPESGRPDPALAVSELYEMHAVGLLRLAVVLTGDRQAAEDVLHDAFLGLYRRWHYLSRVDSALQYLRSSVLNGSRSVGRRRRRLTGAPQEGVPEASAEAIAMVSQEQREVLVALRDLPPRQRQVLTLRFYLDLSTREIAQTMGINQGTVKSTTSRALAALGRRLREDQCED
jgi:RNA polymerase sigma-70 factor (sigma-E family)